MTYKQAIDAGYKNGRTSLERGYISRRINVENQHVYYSGRGGKGDPYVILPCFFSTGYKKYVSPGRRHYKPGAVLQPARR